jgi:acyl-coenzyme A synthetase/AMP-(fatty) acid ligase/3-hydroxymyristoyl/3-hydroxydecanoyl-(acyl carrier protein) dehydratase
MIRELFARPDDHLVAFGDAGPCTVEELRAASGQIARALADRPPGDVLMIFDDRFALAAALIGAWRARRAVLLPPNGQPDTLRSLAQRPDVAAFLHDRAGSPEGEHVSSLLSGAAGSSPVEDLAPELRAATLATSGSTGVHQLLRKTAAQLLGEAATLASEFRIDSSDRVIATIPSHHIYGLLFGVLAPLHAGAAFLRETPVHAEAVSAAVKRRGATFLVSVPAHLRALDALSPAPYRLRRVFSAGARLSNETARMIIRVLGIPVTDVYGTSETGGIAWRDDIDGPWRPFRGVNIDARDDGRLVLDSPLLDEDLPRPFVGADRIALRSNGQFDLLGRVDDTVKVGGKRVSLGEMEARALAVPGVRDAAAMAESSDSARGNAIWLAVAGAEVTAEQIRTELMRWLDPTTLPRSIRVVERLPREDTGKIKRSRLRALFGVDDAHRELELEAGTVHADATADRRTFELTVRPDLAYFEGHFPGKPILAGVVQLHGLALRQTSRTWPDLGFPRKVLRLKFRRVVVPGERLTLRLVRPVGERRVSFQILVAAQECASGTLVFSAEAPCP